MKKNISTVIEITDDHIKLLQTQVLRGNPQLMTCDIEPIDSHTEEHLFKLFKKIAFRHSIQTDKLTFILPRKLVILKQIGVPSVNEGEIDKMIGLQLVNQIPYPVQDVVYDYYILDKGETGYTTTMVIIVHKDVIDRYLTLFRRLDIHLNKLTFSSLGIVQLYYFLGKSKEMDVHKSFLLISVDAGHSELCFFRDKKLYFSRSIGYGAKDLSQAGITTFLNQIQLTLHTYREESFGAEIENFFIFSELNESELLKEMIEKEFKLPCEIVSYSEDIPTHKSFKLSGSKEHKNCSFSVGLGFLFAHQDKMLNFIPQEVYDTKLKKIKKRQMITFFSLLLTLLFLVVGVIGIDVFEKISIVRSLENQLNATQSKVRQAKDHVQLTEVFQTELDHRIVVSDIIYELNKLVPIEISLRSFDLSQQGVLNIKGYAKTSASLNNFQGRLVKSPLFQ